MLFSINDDLIGTSAARDFVVVAAQLNSLGDAVFRYGDSETRYLAATLKSPESVWQLAAYDVAFIRSGKGTKASNFLRLAAQFKAAGVKTPSNLGLDTYIWLGEMSRKLGALRKLGRNPFIGMLLGHATPESLLRGVVNAEFAAELNELGLTKTLHAIALCSDDVLGLADTAHKEVWATALRPEDFWVTAQQLADWSTRRHIELLQGWWGVFSSTSHFQTAAVNAIFFFSSLCSEEKTRYGFASPRRVGLTVSEVHDEISRLREMSQQEKLKRRTSYRHGHKSHGVTSRDLVRELETSIRKFEIEWSGWLM